MAADPIAALLGEGDDTDADPKEDAAKDVLAAIKANDAKALSLAFERIYEACKHAPEPTDEDEDEEA